MNAEFKTMESGLLPMKRGRLIKTLADSTIRGVADAIVELVTNSDDSYRRAELESKNLSGRIDITVRRERDGHCREIIVSDEALGMDCEILKKALEFSGETSGFKEGRTVRGFFGRGLKESIIALGTGIILSLKDGIINRAKIYYDKEKGDAAYNLAVPITNLSIEDLLNLGFIGRSGTIVKIEVANKKRDYIPSWKTFPNQIKNHFALRDINSSPKRKVFVHCYDIDKDSSEQVKCDLSTGKLILEEDVKLDKDLVHFRIYESMEQLESPKNPYGRAGLLIKTEAAILDNQLFGFENDPTALYFFGEIICPGIARIIREGDESIVDYNRGGLDWRHEYSKELEKRGKEILLQLIEEKKEKLGSGKKTEIAKPIEKILEKLCKKLSELAKEELEEPEPSPGEIDSFMVRPLFANIEPNSPRSFSAYCPRYLTDDQGTKIVKFSSSNPGIKALHSGITLDFHKKYSGIMYGSFKIVGEKEGDVATITANLGNLIATTEVRVGPQKQNGGRKKKLKKGGGMFRKIIPAPDENPIQRFEYVEGGIIKIYVKFPIIGEYLGDSFEGLSTPEGRILLAEVLIEAFSRFISRKKAGKYFSEEIDPFTFEMDRLRRKVTREIYLITLSPEIQKLLDLGSKTV